MKLFIKLLAIAFLINGCIPRPEGLACENPNIKVIENKDYKENKDAITKRLIINEGTYTYGNASITSFAYGLPIMQNVFKDKNNMSIGDVLQSAYRYKNEIFLIVNNSQKIEVVDEKDLQRKRTLVGFTSPRYMTSINGVGLITDLYANKISVINMERNCEYESIKMKGWTEQIFNIDNRIYVIERSEVGATSLFANIVEIERADSEIQANFNIVNRTSIAIEPQSVVKDYEGNIWILSSGKESENVYPTITKFNTTSNSIEKQFTYNSYNNIPQNLTVGFDSYESDLYYNQGTDIYSISKDSDAFATQKAFPTIAQNIYSLSYNDYIGAFYVFDAKDYISAGKVYVYDKDGGFKTSIPAGVIPSKIIF